MLHAAEPDGLRSSAESPLAPPDHLCVLAQAAVGGEFASGAFEPLDRALREDTLSSGDRETLSLLAPILSREVADQPLIGLIAGLRRRSTVKASAAELLTCALESELASRGVETIVTGDLGVARAFYAETGERSVLVSTVIVPREVSAKTRAEVIRNAAQATGATVVPGRTHGIERYGVRVWVRSSLAPAFGFPAARRWIRQTAGRDSEGRLRPARELLLAESIYQSALGAPRIRWFTDVVFASRVAGGIRWDKLVETAEALAWTAPVTEAMEVLAERGWAVPQAGPALDHRVDRAYWAARQHWQPGSTAARLRHRAWLAARLARHGSISLPSTSRQ